MRRLLALGLGCLASFTASSEDLLTIFDQAVVNDPTVREAEFTRQATREARPQAWAAYLPQITGSYNKGESEGESGSAPVASRFRIPTIRGGSYCSRSPRTSRSRLKLPTGASSYARPSFNWGGLVALKQSSRIAAQADADYGVAQQDLALRVSTRYFDVLAALDNMQAQQAVTRRHFAPARAGRQAIRSRPHRHHRRAGSARRARHRRRGSDRREAPVRHLPGTAARDHRHAVPGALHAARHHAARHSGTRGSAEVGRSVDGAKPRADLEPARRGDRP